MPDPAVVEAAESVTAQLRALGEEVRPVCVGADAVIETTVAFIERLTQPDPVAVLEKLADDMLEAARYTRSEPDHVRRKIDEFHVRLTAQPTREAVEAARLSDNLFVGNECLAVQPEVAHAYLKSAAAELKHAANRIRVRKEKESEALEESRK